MPQFARPDADTTLGTYTNDVGGAVNIFQAIDETVASDADFIRSVADPVNEIYVARLSDVSDPLSSTNHILRVRAGTDQAVGGSQIDMIVQLRQGYVNEGTPGTLIATLTQANISQGSFTTYTLNLSGIEADAITNYNDLFLRVSMNRI